MHPVFPHRLESKRSHHALQAAFTLIELLVVIAIIAILSVVVILTLNPASLLQQSRDTNRISDMATIQSAINLFTTDQSNASPGQASTTYVSIPDPSATSTFGDQCQGLNLPALATGVVYHCAASSTVKNVNGTGWIPVNLSSISFSSPLSNLPLDPVNTTSSGLYYTYTTNGTQYEVNAILESQKYKSQFANSPQVPYYPEVIAGGSNLTINPLYNQSGLIGYWPLNEGSGTVAYDNSGNGNNGAWVGSVPYYSSNAKVGPWAGSIASSTNTYLNLTNNFSQYIQPTTITLAANMPSFTISIWVEKTLSGNGIIFGKEGYNAGILDGVFEFWDSSNVYHGLSYTAPALNTWYMATMSYNPSTQTAYGYINGQSVGSLSMSGYSFQANGQQLALGGFTPWNFTGLEDDARIYNRVLSPAEIAALYNAEK